MNAPSFRLEKKDDGTMLLHYFSDRQGLCHIVPGIIECVAKDFFNSDVTMQIIYQSQEKERTGKKEHVIFEVLQKFKGHKKTCKQRQDSQDKKHFCENQDICVIPSSPFTQINYGSMRRHSAMSFLSISCLTNN
ncbi:hypothetical protein FKM82_009566 [Ascaphus truei]